MTRPPSKHPHTHALKLAIAQALNTQKLRLRLSSKTFGTLTGLSPPDVSKILHNHVERFTLEYLCRALSRSGMQAHFHFTELNLALAAPREETNYAIAKAPAPANANAPANAPETR